MSVTLVFFGICIVALIYCVSLNNNLVQVKRAVDKA